MGSSSGISLLFVEDDPNDARTVERMLYEHPVASDQESRDLAHVEFVDHVDNLADGLERVTDTSPEVVLLDLNLPDCTGLETLQVMVNRAPSVPIVVLTGETDVGIDAIRRGAQDYLVKGAITGELLLRTLRYAVERSRTRHELRDLNHRLSLLNRIVRTDIRNDVSMIVGWSDRLRDRVDEVDSDAVESVLEASQHMLDLTDTAATLMDVLSTNLHEQREPCDLYGVLDAELETIRQAYDVDIAVDRVVPDIDSVIVAGSPLLGAVFNQLLTNAAIHTDRVQPRITVATEIEDGCASVEIADDGVGMPDAQKSSIVDADGANASRSGMGSGLYLVTTVLEAIGGDLDIRDNVPRGTVVIVTLDLIRPY